MASVCAYNNGRHMTARERKRDEKRKNDGRQETKRENEERMRMSLFKDS